MKRAIRNPCAAQHISHKQKQNRQSPPQNKIEKKTITSIYLHFQHFSLYIETPQCTAKQQISNVQTKKQNVIKEYLKLKTSNQK